MRRLLIDETVVKRKLRFKKGMFEKWLDAFPICIVVGVYLALVYIIIYSLKGDILNDYLFVPILGLLLIIWVLIGWMNKGKLKHVERINRVEAIEWVEKKLSTDDVKDVLKRIDENYIGLRYSGWSIGAYHRDIYVVFIEDGVYVTSIAVGRYNDASSFHYFMNKSKTNDLIKELNSLKSRT